jgi:hypothetical protein
VLVDIGPVDAITGSTGLPIRPLLWRCIAQARISRDGYPNGAFVHQIDDQVLIVAAHIIGAFVSGCRRAAHHSNFTNTTTHVCIISNEPIHLINRN